MLLRRTLEAFALPSPDTPRLRRHPGWCLALPLAPKIEDEKGSQKPEPSQPESQNPPASRSVQQPSASPDICHVWSSPDGPHIAQVGGGWTIENPVNPKLRGGLT